MKEFEPKVGMTLVCKSAQAFHEPSNSLGKSRIRQIKVGEICKVILVKVGDNANVDVYLKFTDFEICIGDVYSRELLFGTFEAIENDVSNETAPTILHKINETAEWS